MIQFNIDEDYLFYLKLTTYNKSISQNYHYE